MSKNVYIGIDVGKGSHVASLLSSTLLSLHGKYSLCPTLTISNARSGFDELIKAMRQHTPLRNCHVLLEKTGHYGTALEQFLQEHKIKIYRIQASKRLHRDKTDKHDAQALAVALYSKLELKVPLVDTKERITALVAPSDTAQLLHGLVRHRYELTHETTRRKNKLTSLCDELFPELTQVYSDPNSPSALALRQAYPTPQAVAAATIDELRATRLRNYPARANLLHLQELAATSIGAKDNPRRETLLLEQEQLIAELHLFQQHMTVLNERIEAMISASREGQILTSFGIGSVQAAILLSGIGSIANFENAAKLRAYLGWAPRRSQTGTSYDSVVLHNGGNMLLKQTMYMITMAAVKREPWHTLYARLVARKCDYDARTQRYRGKMKVIGRIAGQIIKVMFVLLKHDYDLLQSLPEGATLPEPTLYQRERHMLGGGKGESHQHTSASSA